MEILENFLLSDIVYYHIGGRARYVVKVTTESDLIQALRFIKEKEIKESRVIGLGSNILLPDSDFSGAIIWLEGVGTSHELLPENRIRVFAGDSLDSLIQFSFTQSLEGLEWAGGLPSTIGGAVRGNAGCFGSEIKDSVVSVEVIDSTDPQFEVRKYSPKQSEFRYRDTYFKHHPELIIVSATFQLQKGSDESLKKAHDVYQANIAYRQKNHPMEYPSCGSVFKNIVEKEKVEKILSVWPDVRELSENKWHKKIAVGYIINRLGFSGKKVGGAQVSEKHANYIVNIDHAKADDVRTLIMQIQKKFEDTFGFTPEPEVILVDK